MILPIFGGFLSAALGFASGRLLDKNRSVAAIKSILLDYINRAERLGENLNDRNTRKAIVEFHSESLPVVRAAIFSALAGLREKKQCAIKNAWNQYELIDFNLLAEEDLQQTITEASHKQNFPAQVLQETARAAFLRALKTLRDSLKVTLWDFITL